mmetsp:Transcript_31449/g.90836  ORF Transcript_31449/g.90836 Transcript_31449/m.90836 type:complete len:305 (+) Transcript_31449:63-977(+)
MICTMSPPGPACLPSCRNSSATRTRVPVGSANKASSSKGPLKSNSGPSLRSMQMPATGWPNLCSRALRTASLARATRATGEPWSQSITQSLPSSRCPAPPDAPLVTTGAPSAARPSASMSATTSAPVLPAPYRTGQRQTRVGHISTSKSGEASAASGMVLVSVLLGPISRGSIRTRLPRRRRSAETRFSQPGKISAGTPPTSRAGMRSAKRADTASTLKFRPWLRSEASKSAANLRKDNVASAFKEPLSTSAIRTGFSPAHAEIILPPADARRAAGASSRCNTPGRDNRLSSSKLAGRPVWYEG